MGSESGDERTNKYTAGNTGDTGRRFRPSPSWTPQPPRRQDLSKGDLDAPDPPGGSQSVPDIGRYFTFYNKEDHSRNLNADDDDAHSDSLDTIFQHHQQSVADDTVTIAETESVAVVHRQASKVETPSLPWWKEVLVIVAVMAVPLLAALTTYLLNHTFAGIFDLPM